MTLGPGKYDKICTEVRTKTNAEGVLLIVVNGNLGQGFSCQCSMEILATLPAQLRYVASEIEKSGIRA